MRGAPYTEGMAPELMSPPRCEGRHWVPERRDAAMFEVFNLQTSETVGFVLTEAEALEAIRRDARLDYLCAMCNAYDCQHLMAPIASLIAALEPVEAPEPWCPHGTDPSCACLDQWDDFEPAI